jgi:hypothetical protein
MTGKTPDALRIKSAGCTLPMPTDQLISEMAQGMYMAVTTAAGIAMSCNDIAVEWKKLHDDVRDFWLAGARSAYAVVAIHGGGKVEGIEDAK